MWRVSGLSVLIAKLDASQDAPDSSRSRARSEELHRLITARTAGQRSVSFPLTAAATAALRIAPTFSNTVTDTIAVVLLARLTLVITSLLGRTSIGIARGELRTLSG